MSISQATGSDQTSTTSTGYGVIDSGGGGEMSINVGTGGGDTYLIAFSGTCWGDTTATGENVYYAIFANGSEVGGTGGHTTRRLSYELSFDGNERLTVAIVAIATVSELQDIDVRWKVDSTYTGYMTTRELTILPIGSTNYIQKGETSDANTSSTDWSATLITPDTQPDPGNYLCIFNASLEFDDTVSPSPVGATRFYIGGSYTLTHTHREMYWEPSFDYMDWQFLNLGKISVGTGDDVDVRWAVTNGSGEDITCHERTLLIIALDSEVDEFGSSESATSTSTSWELMNSSTGGPTEIVDPGVGNYLALFSCNYSVNNVTNASHVDFSCYAGSTRDDDTIRRISYAASFNADDIIQAVGPTGLVTVSSASDDLELWWMSDQSYTRTVGERTLILISEPISFTLDQEGFRWRDDDNDEDQATWLETQDQQLTRPASTNTRLRIIVNATGDPASNPYQLEYRKKGSGDAWRKIEQ